MTIAEEIRDSLDFLIKEARDFNNLCQTLAIKDVVALDIQAHTDYLLVVLTAPPICCTEARIARIQAHMKTLGWQQYCEPLCFRRLT